MFVSPQRPNDDAMNEVGWKIDEWYTGHGTSLCRTTVRADAHWQGHFEDLVLTQCLQPVRARFDFGESRDYHPMSTGEFLLLPARAVMDAAISKPHVSVHCAIPLTVIEAHEHAGLQKDALNVLFRRPFRSPLITMLTKELWMEAREGLPRGRIFGEAAASLLAFALAKASGDAPVVHKGGLSPKKFRLIVDRIDACLKTGITLKDLADVAGLSVWHFSRAFHISAGMPVVEYVNRQRILRAQGHIAGGGVTILEAALEVGFSNPSHFAKLFRRYTGQSPREWLRARQ